MSQANTGTQRRYLIPESELPTHYYNIAADLPAPLPPPLHPGTREPIGPEMGVGARIACMGSHIVVSMPWRGDQESGRPGIRPLRCRPTCSASAARSPMA